MNKINYCFCEGSEWLNILFSTVSYPCTFAEGSIRHGVVPVWGGPLAGPEPVSSLAGSVPGGGGSQWQAGAVWPAQATIRTPLQPVVHQHHPAGGAGAHQLLTGNWRDCVWLFRSRLIYYLCCEDLWLQFWWFSWSITCSCAGWQNT